MYVYVYALVMVITLFIAGNSKHMCVESSSEMEETSPQPTKVNQLVKRFEASLSMRPRPASIHY